MTSDRFSRILQAYGANPERWPVDERQPAEQFLASNRQALGLQADEQWLDDVMNQFKVETDTSRIRSRIMSALPRGRLRRVDKILEWLFPEHVELIWRPILAAALPLALGLGLSLSTMQTADEWDRWEQEIYLMGFIDVEEYTLE